MTQAKGDLVSENNTLTEINEFQQWVQNALMFPRHVDAEVVDQEVNATNHLSSVECLAIYQRSYFARLLACMREQYPALCFSLGEPIFDEFSRDYLLKNPSNSYTLYDLGNRFTAYLRETRPDLDQPLTNRELWIDFMVDLAEFEWKVFGLFDGDGDEGNVILFNSAADLSADKLDDSAIKLQRGFKIQQSSFPVATYYSMVRDGKEPELPIRIETFTAIVRVDYKIRLIMLKSVQYSLLDNLLKYADVSLAIKKTAELTSETETATTIYKYWSAPKGWKDSWLAAGFFVEK